MSRECRLYGRKGSGSMVAEAAVRLAGLPFTFMPTTGAALDAPAFRAISPNGKIPALVLPSGQPVFESLAIILVIDELRPEAGLLPPPGSGVRAVALQWLAFFSASTYPAALRYYYPARHTADGSAVAADAVRARAAADMDHDFALFASAVKGPFLLGNTMTITDVYAAMMADWHPPALEIPAIAALVAGVLDNPHAKAAWESHGYG